MRVENTLISERPFTKMLGRLLQAIDVLFVSGSLKVVTFQGFFSTVFLCSEILDVFWLCFFYSSSIKLVRQRNLISK